MTVNPKKKGASFERDICKRLSIWISSGAHQDLFWRSAMSGGRATVIHKTQARKTSAQHGDIVAVGEGGMPLTNKFSIEAKFYSDLKLKTTLYGGMGRLDQFWKQCVEDANRSERLPMLIMKENMHDTLLCVDKEGWGVLKQLGVPTHCLQFIACQLGVRMMLMRDFLLYADPDGLAEVV